VQFGTVTSDGLSSGSRFTTSGVTAGVDWRAADNLTAGITMGYGTDHTELGLRGTLSGSDSISGTAYASYKPFEFWFIDAVIGAASLGYDNRRFVADDNVTVAGSRKGATWFGAVSTGYEARYGALRFSPYTRLDFMSAELDGYSEQGGSAALLSYRPMAFHSVAGTLGLRGSWDIAMEWGVLTPTARAEYRYAFDGSFQQSMYYTDLGPGQTSTLTQAAATRGTVNTNLGLRARSQGGITAELDYGVSGAAARLQSQTVRGSLKLPF
jgi:outer membrane autotransporter protein